jgi:hypothetical protein
LRINCTESDPQLVITVSRPVDSEWLWDRIFHLLSDFDLFLWWGEDTALTVREDVPTPAQMTLKSVRVADPAGLRSALDNA